jgi:hypothetical protein
MRVKFKDLSLWIKIGVIAGWIYAIVFIISFIYGFIKGFSSIMRF